MTAITLTTITTLITPFQKDPKQLRNRKREIVPSKGPLDLLLLEAKGSTNATKPSFRPPPRDEATTSATDEPLIRDECDNDNEQQQQQQQQHRTPPKHTPATSAMRQPFWAPPARSSKGSDVEDPFSRAV